MAALKIDREVFIFIWKIKNFSFCWFKDCEYIRSPIFQVHLSDTTSCYLDLYPAATDSFIHCYLNICKFGALVDYELSFIHHNESILYSVEVCNASFIEGQYSIPVRVLRDEVFGEEKASFLPHDTLTIQCKIWEVDGSTLKTKTCCAETEIEVQRNSSVCTFERFSTRKKEGGLFQTLNEPLTANPPFEFRMFSENFDNNIHIEITPRNYDLVKFCKCQVFLLDVAGKRIKCGKYECVPNLKDTFPRWFITLSLVGSYLLEKNSEYLPNDVLTLQYDIEFSTGRTIEKIVHDSSQMSQNVPTDNSAASSLPWKDDLLFIYNGGHFCDTKLKTSTEVVPVHSLILSIRSSVFSDMLNVCDSERLNGFIDLKDLNANTVRKMVLYFYTDTLEDLDWESAKNLYVASNKYEITFLKHKCSSFLKENLTTSNCCEVLCLAERYEDHTLISVVHCFISTHDKEILVSDAWRKIEKQNPMVACNILKKLYMEK